MGSSGLSGVKRLFTTERTKNTEIFVGFFSVNSVISVVSIGTTPLNPKEPLNDPSQVLMCKLQFEIQINNGIINPSLYN
jgi:hypothetical protein